MKDIVCIGHTTNNFRIAASACDAVLVDCGFFYSFDNASDAVRIVTDGTIIMKGCVGAYSGKDLLNYRLDSAGAQFVEIDCNLWDAGISGATAVNCSTGHDGVHIVRVNGTYRRSMMRPIHDVGPDTKVWNIGCHAEGGTDTDTYQPAAWAVGLPSDNAKMFLDDCTANGAENDFAVLSNLANLYYRNMRLTGNIVGGSRISRY
jgi:hypothetical protein